MKIKKLLDKILSVLFVKDIKCLYCDKELNKPNKFCLCDDCLSKLEYNNKNTCKKCGVPIGEYTSLCPRCFVSKFSFTNAYSVFVYNGVIKDLIKKFKFAGGKYIGEYLSKFLYEKYVEAKINCDIVIPVPIHKTTLNKRGYNQAEVLCIAFEDILPIRTDILIKQKLTKEQAKLNLSERKKNLQDAFTVNNNEEIKDKSILLIDDVFTTGNTVNECSKTLKKFGAKKVYVLTICSTNYFIIEKINY